jgi:hypothetical protein
VTVLTDTTLTSLDVTGLDVTGGDAKATVPCSGAISTGERGTHTPFAYHLAVPVLDPADPAVIPRMEAHGDQTTYTSCDSVEWCACLYIDE